MLELKNIKVGYGDIIAVQDISLKVEAGEVYSLLGVNGAGKSSTLMSIMGLVPPQSGSISINGTDLTSLNIEDRVHHGITIVPEGRRIFANLTVLENLMVGGHILAIEDLESEIERIYGYFPRLKERHDQLAGSLSGGEQQMLAMGRGLLSNPKLLLVDELSLGLMPKVVDECYRVIDKICKDGVAVLLVDQNTEKAMSVANHVTVLEAGNTIWAGTASDARKDKDFKKHLMGMD